MINFNKLIVEDFDLNLTLSGAQTFVWDFLESGLWVGKTLDGIIILKQNSNSEILWQTYPNLNDKNLVTKYLRLNFDYSKLLQEASKDKYFNEAVKQYKGMRLLKQNINEVIIAFIISANNNYKSIKNSVRKLSEAYGKLIIVDGNKYFLFPSPEALANAGLEDIKKASVGFRAKYILETARYLADEKYNFLGSNDDEEKIREELLKLKGVGNKVADCVLTFGYGFDNIAPIDVWVGRVLERFYGLPKMSYKQLRQWTKQNMYGYASWVSQYLFEYIRTL